ncbi:hypothetical protein [Paraburkholderia tropica]|uniref:hypothetical protein n=1 Tax=Paraburkholderia tropica TaxID=92647 RepID=UPI001591CAD1|nr:hypothetical protein [Paraburkholderia tropica]MBB3002216.1 hypothetical protein [Paraburkholderia tropica]MBB6321599.1 hypothetical protein [Paraburkholderia tropica]QNB13109.1 DUF4175 domain-containing protein [Paraburkholderia tropica]
MFAATFQRLPQAAAARIARACERASGVGIVLLPIVYIAFFAALFMLGVMPRAPFGLTMAMLTLGGAMLAGALIFYLASVAPQARPSTRATAAGCAGLHAPITAPAHAPTIAPIRFAHMPTRTCQQSCKTASGEEIRIAVNCYQAHCPAANQAESRRRSTCGS